MQKNQLYHLETPYGLINDPNAFLKFKDTYYLFFQWNPLAKDHSFKDWGYFTSKNLIDWDFCGQAIKANSFYDRDGVYSGTGIVYNDQIYLYYTGNVRPGGMRKSFQNIVTSVDGEKFIKEGILLSSIKGFTEHVRDPKVFIYNNQFYMLLAAQEVKGTGAIILCTGSTPNNFSFLKTLATTQKFQMVECPDIAFFGDKALLNYALQARDNDIDKALDSRSYYKVITYDFKTNQLSNGDLDDNEGLIDYGFDFYVPQTLKLDDDRTIMVAWMSNMTKEEETVFSQKSFNIHCMTMFREIELDGNRLIQHPVKEYNQLLGEKITPEDNKLFFNNRTWRVSLNYDNPDIVDIKINNETEIHFDKTEGLFEFTRFNWVNEKKESKSLKLESLDSMEIWSDVSSLEIYINNGTYTMSSRIDPKEETSTISFLESEPILIEANELKFSA